MGVSRALARVPGRKPTPVSPLWGKARMGVSRASSPRLCGRDALAPRTPTCPCKPFPRFFAPLRRNPPLRLKRESRQKYRRRDHQIERQHRDRHEHRPENAANHRPAWGDDVQIRNPRFPDANLLHERAVRPAKRALQREIVRIQKPKQNRRSQRDEDLIRLIRPRLQEQDRRRERHAPYLARAAVVPHARNDALHYLDMSPNRGGLRTKPLRLVHIALRRRGFANHKRIVPDRAAFGLRASVGNFPA